MMGAPTLPVAGPVGCVGRLLPSEILADLIEKGHGLLRIVSPNAAVGSHAGERILNTSAWAGVTGRIVWAETWKGSLGVFWVAPTRLPILAMWQSTQTTPFWAWTLPSNMAFWDVWQPMHCWSRGSLRLDF